ncbi:MAG TPA: benzoate/H(+) symporter BenE family transporter [Dongiaceae bacterium]
MTAAAPATGSIAQPISAGVLAAIVGFASAFPVVLQGLAGVGATPAEAASGLLALCIGQGVLAIWLGLRSRMPIAIAWSTPGAALLASAGAPAGFAVAVGAFLVAAALVIVAGLWRPFARAVESIPITLASAMLAGVLMHICLAPVEAVGRMPALALPIVIAWAVAWRFVRPYAVPIAVIVTAAIVFFATPIPEGALSDILPQPVLVTPALSLDAVIGIALPLFIVTMASQNLPGLAVLSANGYRPSAGPLFLSTGIASAVVAPFGGHALNLAAITAALCASPEAHPDPAKRYIASVSAGASYLAIALFAGFAAAFIAASPPLLIQAVAGLALLGSLVGALTAAFAKEDERIPAILTFITAASGVSFFGIGPAFWGLIAGGAVMALMRFGRK